jgi:hypothetical protein
MNVSTTLPTTVQIGRGHLIGLIVAVATLAAAITWLLVGFAFDSGATPTQQSVSRPSAVNPPTAPWNVYPNYRGMP